MVTLSFTPLAAASTLLSSPLPPPPPPRGFSTSLLMLKSSLPHSRNFIKRKTKGGVCRAEWSRDAPFVAAIGASMLSSLLLPNAAAGIDDDGESSSGLDTTDARFAVMGIVSFIPYFNWLVWVFAWLDTGKRRYAIYAIVYLAPYIRSNLSLSPEESWLPIVSIILCIVHVQLEASIKNGDIQGFQLFSKATEALSSLRMKKHIDYEDHRGPPEEGKEGEDRNLPSADERAKREIRQWEVPRKPSEHSEHSTVDWDDDDKRKKE